MIAFPDFDITAWLAIAFLFFSIFGRSLGWVFDKIGGGASAASARARMRERRETQLLENEESDPPPEANETGVVQALERELGIVRAEGPSVVQVQPPAVTPPPPPPPPVASPGALEGVQGAEEIEARRKKRTGIERSRSLAGLRKRVDSPGQAGADATRATRALELMPRGIAGWRRAFVLGEVLGTPVALRAPGAAVAPPGLS